MIYSEIKQSLKERGLSIDWLAREVGVKPSTLYSRFARDDDKIDIALILKICELLRLPVEHFIGGVGAAMQSPTLKEWELLYAWRALDDGAREIIRALIDRLCISE